MLSSRVIGVGPWVCLSPELLIFDGFKLMPAVLVFSKERNRKLVPFLPNERKGILSNTRVVIATCHQANLCRKTMGALRVLSRFAPWNAQGTLKQAPIQRPASTM